MTRDDSDLPPESGDAAIGPLAKIEQDDLQPLSDLVELHATGLRFKRPPSFEEWLSVGKGLRRLRDATDSVIVWAFGDWLNVGEHDYGEKYKEGMQLSGYSYQTCADIAYTARRFESSRRHEKLSFWHHRFVAQLKPDEQDQILDTAEREKWWSVWQTRNAVKALKAAKADVHRAKRAARLAPPPTVKKDDRVDAEDGSPADEQATVSSAPTPVGTAGRSASTAARTLSVVKKPRVRLPSPEGPGAPWDGLRKLVDDLQVDHGELRLFDAVDEDYYHDKFGSPVLTVMTEQRSFVGFIFFGADGTAAFLDRESYLHEVDE
jgi:hypothetical protein